MYRNYSCILHIGVLVVSGKRKNYGMYRVILFKFTKIKLYNKRTLLVCTIQIIEMFIVRLEKIKIVPTDGAVS